MNKVLEIYPSTHGCIQGCFHCPRGITKPPTTVVDEITNEQRELARNILFCFGEDSSGVNALNLSGYVGEYGFQLFDDIGGMSLNQLYFNFGVLSRDSLGLVNDNVSRLNDIIPLNTGDRDIDIFGNLQCVAGGGELLDSDLLRGFVRDFFIALRLGAQFSNQEMLGLMLASNNTTQRNKREINLQEVLSNFVSSHSQLGEPTIISDSVKDYPKKGVSFVRSDRVIDGKQTRIDYRGVSAKKSKRSAFLDELKLSIRDDMDLTISIFPDTIMVYHSTWNIHIDELFFSYEEFEQLLRGYICQTGSERYTLKQFIDERLAERAYHLGLFKD